MAEQKKISGILLKYDELIQNNNNRIIQLEDIAQELYREWFVRFRFPGYENAKFEDGIPEGWKNKRMNEFCYVTDGTHDTPKPVDVFLQDLLISMLLITSVKQIMKELKSVVD